MHIEDIEIPVPWGAIRGKTWGNKTDSPVLMVHGLQDNAGTFDNLIPQLPAKGFYYICIDLPGHGRSSHYPPHVCYTIMNYVENIRIIVVEYLKLEAFSYVGHSMGGHIGYIFAAAFPEKVVKFIALDTIIVRMVPSKLVSLRVRERISELVRLEHRLVGKMPPKYSYEEAVSRIGNSRMNVIPESGARVLAKRALIETEEGFTFSTDQRLKLNVLSEFCFEQYKSFIDSIQCPMTIILAVDSVRAYKAVSQKYHERLFKDKKNYKQFIVNGNHDVHLNEPEIVAPIISKLLQEETSSKL